MGPLTSKGPPVRPASLLGLPLALLLLVFPAHSQRTDLEKIRADIRALRGQLESVRQQAAGVARDLETVELELGIRTRELDLATAAEQRLDAEERAVVASVATLGPRIERQKADLKKRLAALYRLGGLSYLRVALTLENERNPLEALSMLTYLASRDARLVARFQETKVELALRQQQLRERRETLRSARRVVEQQRQQVIAAQRSRTALLAHLRRQESGAAAELASLEEKARRLQRLVDALSQQSRGLEPSLDIRSVRGALGWPVEGAVVERFGRERNPKFATFTVNNGIRIAAAAGTPVRAVFQGTVLFSQWFKGYGNLIILDHGNRVFSLYGNVKAPVVTVGNRVVTGQPIAGVGEGEAATSGYLYFEMRQENRPEDPLEWLR